MTKIRTRIKLIFTNFFICLLIFAQLSVCAGISSDEVDQESIGSRWRYTLPQCNIRNGDCGENFAKQFFKQKLDLDPYNIKSDGVHGMDLMFIDEKARVVIIHESKYKGDSFSLSLGSSASGRQLSRDWIASSADSILLARGGTFLDWLSSVVKSGWTLIRTANVSSKVGGEDYDNYMLFVIF